MNGRYGARQGKYSQTTAITEKPVRCSAAPRLVEQRLFGAKPNPRSSKMVFAAMQTRLGNAFAYRWRSASMLGRWNPRRTSVAGHPEWRPCQRSSNFPHCLPSKVPRAPVFNEDQFSRVRVRPETRIERPKAGQESLSSLTFTRSHWRVGGASFWR